MIKQSNIYPTHGGWSLFNWTWRWGLPFSTWRSLMSFFFFPRCFSHLDRPRTWSSTARSFLAHQLRSLAGIGFSGQNFTIVHIYIYDYIYIIIYIYSYIVQYTIYIVYIQLYKFHATHYIYIPIYPYNYICNCCYHDIRNIYIYI